MSSSEQSSDRRLVIWGAGGHGKVVADVARAAGWTVVGYIDADASKRGHVAEPGGARVIFDEAALFATLAAADRSFDAVAIAIGNNQLRLSLRQRLRPLVALPALVHPSAVVSPSAVIGDASVVMPLAIINASAHIGAAVIINSGAVVEHDCSVEDGAHVSPNATVAGGARLGELAWVGAGACVIPSVRVGRASVVGAGAVVIRDVAEGVTVVGCPARQIR